VSRDTEFNWPADVFCVLQRNLSFYYVWNWPIGFGGVEVMNLALATAFQPVQEVSANDRGRKNRQSQRQVNQSFCVILVHVIF